MADRCQKCSVLLAISSRSLHEFCSRCERELLKAGLCKWCGRAERDGLRHTCEPCAKRISEASRAWAEARGPMEVLPAPLPAKYRGIDARENTTETKGG